MRYGIMAEGHSDIAVIKSIMKALKGIDGNEIISIRPEEQYDESDLNEMKFSNWNLVMTSCADEQLLNAFFNDIEDNAFLIVQIDAAERSEVGYDLPFPIRSKDNDWKQYAIEVRKQIKEKIRGLIPEAYQDKIAYAITIEETDAWLIPLFNIASQETAQYASPKEKLQNVIGTLSKKEKLRYINTRKKRLDYTQLANQMKRKLNVCRSRNVSLDLFCLDLDNIQNT